MLIVSGNKKKIKPIGYVADLCPICKSIKQFEVKKVSIAGHLYGVTLGDGDTQGHLKECLECKTQNYVNILKFKTVNKSLSSIKELISETYPDIEEINEKELSIYDMVSTNPQKLDAESRSFFIRHVFEYLAPYIEELYSSETRFDRKTGTGCLGTVFAFIGLFVIAGTVNIESETSQSIFGFLLLVVPLMGGLVTFYFLLTQHKRYIKEYILPAISKSLYELRPKKGELDSILNDFKSMKLKFGKKIKSNAILDHISLVALKK